MNKKLVTIIGAGFGGVYTARNLLRRGFAVRLIGCDGFFTFTPLLHEVATGMLCEGDVRFGVRTFLKSTKLEVIRAGAEKVNLDSRSIKLSNGASLEYDTLVIATGARPRLDVVEGADYALCLKTIADAKLIREKVISLIQRGAYPIEINIVGGGFTGLELACEVDQLLEKKVGISSKLRLFERGPRPLAETDALLARYIARRLRKSEIDFHADFTIDRITAEGLEGHDRQFSSDLTILTAGVQPNTELIDEKYRDHKNNIVVTPYLNLPSHPEVFALGDIIALENKVKPPMLAQLAVQQAAAVSRNIDRQRYNLPLKAYRVRLKGVLVSLGTWDAVGRIFGLPIVGRLAWYIWRTVYLFKTPGLKNRLRIAWRWTIYLFRKRLYIPPAAKKA